MFVQLLKYLFKRYTAGLFERDPHIFQHSVNVVHCAIDPSGGGSSSEYAIVSIAHEENQWAIVGIDCSNSFHHNEIIEMLSDHVLGLRALPLYEDALFVFYIEANLSFIAVDQLKNFFSQPQFGNVYIVSRDPKNLGRPGVWTSAVEKELYSRDLEKVLSDGKLSFADQLVSDNAENNKVKLIAQLNYFSRQVIQPSDPSKLDNKVIFSGKGTGRRDDLCLALMIGLTNAQLTLLDKNFLQLCTRNGWRF